MPRAERRCRARGSRPRQQGVKQNFHVQPRQIVAQADMRTGAEGQMQELTDQSVAEVDRLVDEKEAEVMEV